MAKDINDLLFTPKLETPIKTLDVPLAGKGYSTQTLSLILDLINITNDTKNESELTDDLTGIDIIKKANINLDGLFLNADPGFDSESFREACEEENIIPNVKPNARNSTQKDSELSPIGTTIFDEKLYEDRSVIEHSNAWTVRRCD